MTQKHVLLFLHSDCTVLKNCSQQKRFLYASLSNSLFLR
jgi:hypothetical protein